MAWLSVVPLHSRAWLLSIGAAVLAGAWTLSCGAPANGCCATGLDAGGDAGAFDAGSGSDAGADDAGCGQCALNEYCDTATHTCHPPHLEHVVLIVQENHTFESYFGAYCTAPAGSAPACTSGPACCEAAPSSDTPTDGRTPVDLTDSENYGYDRDHSFACEQCEMDGTPAAMDHYTDGTCPNDASSLTSWSCSSPHNWAVANTPGFMSTYWGYADTFALADRYFQPIVGSTSSNDMYFAVARYQFIDNTDAPNAIGWNCDPYISRTAKQFTGPTIADLLIAHGNTFGVYADGYADAVTAAASGNCPSPPSDSNVCPESFLTAPSVCIYDPSDIPFQYYPSLTDNPQYIHDLSAFSAAVSAGTLPDFAYVKYRTSQNEHPGWSYISRGQANVSGIASQVLSSPVYGSNTLVLVTWDEGGGFYDHVPPPPSVETFPPGDANAPLPVPYGTRVPLLALGPFARAGTVSHVAMEHSSVVRFLEFLFLGSEGGLGARDAVVNDLGSLLDSTAIGVTVPTCNASCAGRQCGSNGCGTSCGTCAAGAGCSNGACVTCGASDGGCGGCVAPKLFFCASNATCYATADEAAEACGATCMACP